MNYLLDNPRIVLQLTGEHLFMAGTAVFISGLIALPLSWLLMQSPRLSSIVLGLFSVIYTIPSIALLILLLPFFGLNQTSVIVALIIYTQIILLRNLIAGLQGVSPSTMEAATGLGMNGWQRWWRVQLPLALPITLAGVRLALIIAIAIATIGAKFGAGGLGTLLFDGIAQNRHDKLFAGSLVITLLALGLNYLLLALESYFSVERHSAKESLKTYESSLV